jgi:hypothetical protein
VEAWHDFGVLAGSASGALTGLLFVAVSLNADRIGRQSALRVSAGQTLVLFVTPLLVSVIVVTPGQKRWMVGTELVALGILTGATLVLMGRRKRISEDELTSRIAKLLDRTSPNLVTMALIETAGVTLLADGGGGLYWLVPAVVAALVGGVTNAWLFLVLPTAGPADQLPTARPGPR